MSERADRIKTIATNRKARHLYHVDSTVEAGLSLLGTEVKSLRAGHVSFQDAYAAVENGELILRNLHINPYSQALVQHEPLRPRRLLLHRREIDKLAARVLERGYTLIPLQLYWKNGRAKVELALCRGKKQYDKREDEKKREQEREMAAATRRAAKA
ncbi:SsrA-binding protein SmpB [bacterium]|nr:SsrA-binding protein SmpB [bacterium]